MSWGSDEEMIRARYKELMDGWNVGSGEAFAAPFADDAKLIGFDGTLLRSRREIATFHQPLFDKWLRGTKLVGNVSSVQFLARDVALVHAVGGTILRGKKRRSHERDSIQTLVATRRGQQWYLQAFQNTRVRPIGTSTRGTMLWLLSDWLWKVFGPLR